MSITVTKESLTTRIADLELLKESGTISLHGKYNLAAYKMLLATMEAEPVVSDDVVGAIENLKNTLVDCNRYNYCSDAVERLENACRAAMLNQK